MSTRIYSYLPKNVNPNIFVFTKKFQTKYTRIRQHFWTKIYSYFYSAWKLYSSHTVMSSYDSITLLLALARKAESANLAEEDEQQKGRTLDGEDGGSYSHPNEDYIDHLEGRWTGRGRASLRHRKVCKYLSSGEVYLRGYTCEYLQPREVEI